MLARKARSLPGLLVRRAGLALACTVVLVLTGSGPPVQPSPARAFRVASTTTALTQAGDRHVRAAGWWGHVYTASTGEAVAVNVSDSYPVDDTVGQRWADLFAHLVHGSELQLLHVYVAPPAEVTVLCGSPDALGCYGGDRLVVIGEPVRGTDPTAVAEHEYGHHVAVHRLNTPWNAGDWGPKRWASVAGVCQLVAAGAAFPGDEQSHYRQNPGEAFAEVYRVMNDQKTGLTFPWSIQDATFIPGAAAVAAVEQDVVHPWTAPTRTIVRGAFTARGTRVWSRRVMTPLDGLLTVSLSFPRGGLYTLTLLGSDGRTALAHGLWSGTTVQTMTFTICGQRSFLVRVVRVGPAGPFALVVGAP